MSRAGPIIYTDTDRALQGGLNAGTAQWAARQRAAQDQAELEAMERWRETQAELERQSLNQRGMFEAAAEDRWWRKQLFDEATAYGADQERGWLERAAQQAIMNGAQPGGPQQQTGPTPGAYQDGGVPLVYPFAGGMPGGQGGDGAGLFAGGGGADSGAMPGGLDLTGAPPEVLRPIVTKMLGNRTDERIRELRQQRADALGSQLYKMGEVPQNWRMHYKGADVEDLLPQYAVEAEDRIKVDDIMSMGYPEQAAWAMVRAERGDYKLPGMTPLMQGQMAQGAVTQLGGSPELATAAGLAKAGVPAGMLGGAMTEDDRVALHDALDRALTGQASADDLLRLKQAKFPGLGSFLRQETPSDVQLQVRSDERWQRASDAATVAESEWKNAMADADRVERSSGDEKEIKAAQDREMSLRNRFFQAKDQFRRTESEVRRGMGTRKTGTDSEKGKRTGSGPGQSQVPEPRDAHIARAAQMLPPEASDEEVYEKAVELMRGGQ